MTGVKMPLVSVNWCVTAFKQVSADVCKGDGSDRMRTARGSKMALFVYTLYG